MTGAERCNKKVFMSIIGCTVNEFLLRVLPTRFFLVFIFASKSRQIVRRRTHWSWRRTTDNLSSRAPNRNTRQDGVDYTFH